MNTQHIGKPAEFHPDTHTWTVYPTAEIIVKEGVHTYTFSVYGDKPLVIKRDDERYTHTNRTADSRFEWECWAYAVYDGQAWNLACIRQLIEYTDHVGQTIPTL